MNAMLSPPCSSLTLRRVVGILTAATMAPSVVAGLDTEALANRYFGNDAPWYRDRIPYFEISDSSIQDVFYYRWGLFRAHQRDLGERGYVSTGELNISSYCRMKLTPEQNSWKMSAGN